MSWPNTNTPLLTDEQGCVCSIASTRRLRLPGPGIVATAIRVLGTLEAFAGRNMAAAILDCNGMEEAGSSAFHPQWNYTIAPQKIFSE